MPLGIDLWLDFGGFRKALMRYFRCRFVREGGAKLGAECRAKSHKSGGKAEQKRSRSGGKAEGKRIESGGKAEKGGP